EVALLDTYYRGVRHANHPIAVWAAQKRDTTWADGTMGTVPIPSPNAAAFGVTGFPTYVVVDRHGVVRRFGAGDDNIRTTEDELIHFIEALHRESTETQASNTAPALTSNGIH